MRYDFINITGRKMMLKRMFILSAFFGSLFVLTGISATETTLVDNFDSGLGNWQKPANRFIGIIDGKLANNTIYGSSITLKGENIGGFTLSFRLKFLKNTENSPGHFSIRINRDYGMWNLYFTANANQSQITSQFTPKGEDKKIKPLFSEVIPVPLPIEEWLNVTLICNKNRYELKVGEQQFLLGAAPGRGGVTFGSYKQPFAIDDFKMIYSVPEELSANFLINGSFEYATNPDMPDYWAGNGESYRNLGLPAEICTADGIKEFREKFYLDGSTAFHGKNSLRVQAPFHVMSMGMPVSTGQNYTVSGYLKSDIGDRKVLIGATHNSMANPLKEETINVGKTWQRYELHVSNDSPDEVSFFIKPMDSGNIWIDAVQVEQGENATPFRPCWYDSGFALPDDVNKNQCGKNVNAIEHHIDHRDIISLTKLNISPLKFTSIDAVKQTYRLEFDIENADAEDDFNMGVFITSKTGEEQVQTRHEPFPHEKTVKIRLDDWVIGDLRCCVNIVITTADGKTIKHTREFADVPPPMRIYPEFSFYTDEAEARMVVQFDVAVDKLKNCKLELETVIASYPVYACLKNSFAIKPSTGKQIFNVPIKRLAPNIYTVKARVVDQGGQKIMQCEEELITLRPGKTKVQINRINRGVYVNGKPFLPYGILVAGWGQAQLQYYRKCGFSDIVFISNWHSAEAGLEFLANCEKLDINAMAFHVSRPYILAPFDIVQKYQTSPALVGITPNDENGDRIVYEDAARTKHAYPEILTWVNHNFFSYRAFANRIDGFPGDVLSIDRYPFIVRPPGRPQTTRDIYSMEQCMEMMDRDGVRERKPVFLWLQAAVRFSKEPTPQQLTWQTYIPLVNHGMGFAYFGNIPDSERVWKRMMELNNEVQSLKPALFSLEEEPVITAVDKSTKDNIRFLAKKLGNELTVLCVNRTLYPVATTLDLSPAGINGSLPTEVLFENRKLKTDDKGILKDKFKPLERHVYRIKVP